MTAAMSAPDHITEFVCEDCGDHVHVFGHYYGLPVHSTCPPNPTCPSTSLRGICEATLSRVAKRKKAPAHDAVIPARTHGRRRSTMDDETRRYCVLMVPFALKLFFGLNPESRRFRIYRSRSLLLTPPIQPTGEAGAGTAANAFAFIAWR